MIEQSINVERIEDAIDIFGSFEIGRASCRERV